jgi:hypothetical protein
LLPGIRFAILFLMDIFASAPYLIGNPPAAPEPLARYLPPVTQGVTSAWLGQHVPAGAWVLDPFGASPTVAVEAARAGYRVLVAANNPISRFLLEMAANPPSMADLQAGLAELGASRKEDERLEQHIQSLYQTVCANCHRTIQAEAFIWDRESRLLEARLYTCPHCNDSGEKAPDISDVVNADKWAKLEKMYRSRALERIAPLDDPDREHAEEALAIYLPRTVYALGTIINRIDQLKLTPARLRALTALVLTACDQASGLWAHPTERRRRPRSLALPPHFRENNLWQALEEGLSLWAGTSAPEAGIALTQFPAPPPESGGICLFEGAVRELVPNLEAYPMSAVIGALPRPNQAFWTLSALWAGWLWGREAVGPFKSVLRRRRYDWQWHAEALKAVFTSLAKPLATGTPFFALLTEAEPSFITAALLAAQVGSFDLKAFAMRTDGDPLQLHWERGADFQPPSRLPEKQAVRDALTAYLNDRVESATYLHVHTVGVAALAEKRALAWSDEAVTETGQVILQALNHPTFVHHDAKTTPESGTWGLSKPNPEAHPLVDRVEMAVVRFLQANSKSSFEEIQGALNEKFPGALTPPLALIGAVLDSYGVEDGGWTLREQDSPSIRRLDMEEAQALLENLGGRMNFTVSRADPNLVLWSEGESLAWTFYVIASAVAGKTLSNNRQRPGRTVVVLPGGRAGLLAYKLRRDPHLRQLADGCHFLKFRNLRQIAEIQLLTHETWAEAVRGDPIEGTTAQMMMF